MHCSKNTSVDHLIVEREQFLRPRGWAWCGEAGFSESAPSGHPIELADFFQSFDFKTAKSENGSINS
jgi:hypothetical protein